MKVGRTRSGSVLAVLVATTATACVSDFAGDDATAPVIEVFGPYRDGEADRFDEVVAPFELATGYAVRYTGSANFVAALRERIDEAGDPPDVAIVPQPGLVERFRAEDRLVDLDDAVLDGLDANYRPTVAAFGAFGGDQVGVPFRLTVKSLVWYVPRVFEVNGWDVPASLDELESLVAEIAADGVQAPWCVGVESGTATGWPATDWVEDLVLRLHGAEVYRDWAQGELGFASEEIAAAFSRFDELVLADDRTLGGRRAAVETPVDDAATGLFRPGGCAMFKQANFALSWMPDGVTVGPDGDVDWFVLPGVDADGPLSLVVGVDQAVAFTDAPGVQDLLAFLAGPDAGETWVRAGSFISPKTSVGVGTYPGRSRDGEIAEILDGLPVQFDASDAMPPDLGSDLYWDEITAWMVGGVTYEDLAATLDVAYAALRPDR